MKKIIIACFSLLFSTFIPAQNLQPDHSPTLWLSKTQIDLIRKNSKDTGLKMASWQSLLSSVNVYMHQKVEIPSRGGNWEQFYINPETGNPLRRGKQTGDWQWEHFDKITNTAVKNNSSKIERDFDGVVIALVHNNWALGLVELGLAYQISKKEEYLSKAKQILLSYSKLYSQLPERTRNTENLNAQGSGKIHIQDLNEAQWLVNMTEGADLIWESLTNEERALVADSLLLPGARGIMRGIRDISNIQCWKNTAVAMTGFLLKKQELISWSMETNRGYKAQLTGFDKTGFTLDISPTYQFFSLHPLILQAQTAANNNYPVDIEPIYNMLKAPLAMSNNRLMLPPFNDSRPVRIQEYAYLYEWGFAKFRDSSFFEILYNSKRDFSGNSLSYEFSGWHLLFSDLRYFYKPIPHIFSSKNFDSTGILVLAKGNSDNSLTCYLKYSNQLKKRRHRHNAQLDIAVIKGNEYIITPPGNKNYASALSDNWYRSGVSHNTLLYNESEQIRSTGTCLESGSSSGIDYAMVETNNIFNSDVKHVRTVFLLDENCILIVDQFNAFTQNSSKLDLFYHPAGQWKNTRVGNSWKSPDSIGYKYLTDGLMQEEQDHFSVCTHIKNGDSIAITGVSSRKIDIVTANGPSEGSSKAPAIIFRSKTESVQPVSIAYCTSTDGKKRLVNINQANDSYKLLVTVTEESGRKTIIQIDPDNNSLASHKTLISQSL